MAGKKQVIVLSDGDETAYRALVRVCRELDCYPLRASEGNPTRLNGDELIAAVLKAPAEPVVVMVDDRGDSGQGPGEDALRALTESAELDVLGVVAVAANTRPVAGVDVDVSVDQHGTVIRRAVDKDGHAVRSARLKGDTVDVLKSYRGPVVGLGDPGKMEGHDRLSHGVPATRRAIQEILQWRETHDGRR